MNNYLLTNPWYLVEDEFHPAQQLTTEEKFSICNGKIENRANFEEFYSGETEIGTYVSGFEKCIANETVFSNLPNMSCIHIRLNAEILDLARCEVINFRRTLDMQHNILERTFEVKTQSGHQLEVSVKRFLSLAQNEISAIKYCIKSLNYAGRIAFNPVIDGNIEVFNATAIEPEWNVIQSKSCQEVAHLWIQMRHSNQQLCTAMSYELFKNNSLVKHIPTKIEKQKVAGYSVGCDVKPEDTVFINKYIVALSSLDHFYKDLTEAAAKLTLEAKSKGFNTLLAEHTAAAEQKWNSVEIDKKSNIENQQSEIYKLFRQHFNCK